MKSFRDFIKTKEENLYEMSNLWPKETGLKEIIWVSVKNDNHGPRIKVYKGKELSGPNFSVSIADEPEVLEGTCFVSSKELNNIF